MKNLFCRLVLVLFVAFAPIYAQHSFSQDSLSQAFNPKFSLVFGLTQPILLRGFNVEVDYWADKWMLDYSHGFGLQLGKIPIPTPVSSPQLALDVVVPHTLGIGVGYRFTPALHLRFEPKLHFFDLYFDGDEKTAANRIASYYTFTLGGGVYYRWLPFEMNNDWSKGITVMPSVRYWPNVTSSLPENKLSYKNRVTGVNETHQALNIGVLNTPWIVNISIGYSF